MRFWLFKTGFRLTEMAFKISLSELVLHVTISRYIMDVMWNLVVSVVPVFLLALLFDVHGKHLRSCRDGQLT